MIRDVQSDDEDDILDVPTSAANLDPSKPWSTDFKWYMDTLEATLPPGMSTIQWWGVSDVVASSCFNCVLISNYFQINAQRYGPVWTSLARDYLSIMASSVSSERAFSQGGITISKRRSRLKGDIVEALQCVKCALRNDLLFREPGPSSLGEFETDELEMEMVSGEAADGDGTDEQGWDDLLLEEADDDLESDDEMDSDSDL